MGFCDQLVLDADRNGARACRIDFFGGLSGIWQPSPRIMKRKTVYTLRRRLS